MLFTAGGCWILGQRYTAKVAGNRDRADASSAGLASVPLSGGSAFTRCQPGVRRRTERILGTRARVVAGNARSRVDEAGRRLPGTGDRDRGSATASLSGGDVIADRAQRRDHDPVRIVHGASAARAGVLRR